MSVGDVITLLQELIMTTNKPEIKDSVTTVVVLLLLAMTLLQVSKVKINPWSWVAKHFGRAINTEVMAEIKGLRKEVDDVRSQQRKTESALLKENAIQDRRRILSAADEVRRGIAHSDEFFTEILSDVDAYERYCDAHPEFENSKAINSIKIVRSEHLNAVKDNVLV